MSLTAHNNIEDVIRAGGRLTDQGQSDHERAAFLAARCGKLGASRMNDAMDFLKNGNPSKKRSDYQRDIIAERLTGLSAWHYVSPAMEHGILTQPEAELVYQRLTGHKVYKGEVIDHPRIEAFEATPDLFVGSNGLCEIKCPNTTTFIEWKIAGVVPEDHKNQMIAQCACTGRAWVDFFAFDPRVKEESKRYMLLRFTPTENDILRIEKAAETFLDEVQDMWEAFIMAGAQ